MPVPPEASWRDQLRVGVRVDAIRAEYIQGERVQGWVPSIITETDPDSIFCETEALPEIGRERFDRKSGKIAPAGFRSGDWSWREKIAAGDRLDVFDTQGTWFLSTVLDTREVDIKGKKFKECYIGYRIYMETGTKPDSKGRMYEGWSEQYDSWLSAHSLRIQKYGPVSITH